MHCSFTIPKEESEDNRKFDLSVIQWVSVKEPVKVEESDGNITYTCDVKEDKIPFVTLLGTMGMLQEIDS